MFYFKQKTAYEMRISDWSSDVCSSDLGTLDALFPGRIDLGLGRAPGSDQRVARALRRTLDSDPNAFPRDVMELQSYFADDGQHGIRVVPGAGASVPIWLLGSTLLGAPLAAMPHGRA